MRFLFAATLLLATTAARADAPARATGPAPDVHQMHADDCAKARAKGHACKIIDMGEGDKVEGNVATGEGSLIGIIESGKAPSLISLRRDFIPEILKSAEDL